MFNRKEIENICSKSLGHYFFSFGDVTKINIYVGFFTRVIKFIFDQIHIEFDLENTYHEAKRANSITTGKKSGCRLGLRMSP